MVNPYATSLVNHNQHKSKVSSYQPHQKSAQNTFSTSYAARENRKRNLKFTTSIPSKKIFLNPNFVYPTSTYGQNASNFNAQTYVSTTPLPVQEKDTCSKFLQKAATTIITDIKRELALFESGQAQNLDNLTNAHRLLDFEWEKLSSNTNPDWMELESSSYRITLKKRVMLPTDGHNSNIVGRLIGMGGATLKKIGQTYKCMIGIYGKGSVRDEEKKLNSGDPKYNHLNLPLHLQISITDKPDEAYIRFGQFMKFIRQVVANPKHFEMDGIKITGIAPQSMYENQFAHEMLPPSNKFNVHSFHQKHQMHEGDQNYEASSGQSSPIHQKQVFEEERSSDHNGQSKQTQQKQTMNEESREDSSNQLSSNPLFQAMKFFNESDDFEEKPRIDKRYAHSIKQENQYN